MMERSRCSRWPKYALIVDVPEPGAGFPPLPHAECEVRLVERICRLPDGAVTRLSGKQASRTILRGALREVSLWHAAGHGVFRPESPASSGLVLQGPDEVLSLRDLAQLPAHRLGLVFLSCCWSSDNFVSPGRWVLSVPSTLRAAGAQTIVGSLWEA